MTIKDLFIKNLITFHNQLHTLVLACLILSILFNSIFSFEIITNIKIGEKFNFNKGNIFFEKIEKNENTNYSSISWTF